MIVPYPGASGSVTGVGIPANTTAIAPWKGGAWIFAVHGAGTSSLATSGYQKLPSGLIIQWGIIGCPANYVADTRFAFNLPIAFPSSALQIILSNTGDNNFTPGTQALLISNSRAEVVWGQSSGNALGLAASYVAFGF